MWDKVPHSYKTGKITNIKTKQKNRYLTDSKLKTSQYWPVTDIRFICFNTSTSNISESELVLLSIWLTEKHNMHCCGTCFHQTLCSDPNFINDPCISRKCTFILHVPIGSRSRVSTSDNARFTTLNQITLFLSGSLTQLCRNRNVYYTKRPIH